jgi:hypothetical protein
MKTKHGVFFGFAVILAAAIFTLAGCPTDGGGGGSGSGSGGDTTVTYTGTANGTKYELTITKATGKAAYTPQAGDSYVLIVGSKISTGTVENVSGAKLTLKSSKGGSQFTATVSGSSLTSMTGSITFDGDTGSTNLPSTLTPGGDSGGVTPGGENGGGDSGNDSGIKTNGRLTITGIPAEYNDRYIVARLHGNTIEGILLCAESISTSGISKQKVTAAKITGGSATLKVYEAKSSGKSFVSAKEYAGNDGARAWISIVSDMDVTIDEETLSFSNQIAYSNGDWWVTFSNGIGTLVGLTEEHPTFTPAN